MFVQATKCKHGKSTYLTYLVRESFRTPKGPRSRTVCNITDLPPDTRELIVASLKGQSFVPAQSVQLHQALDYGGLSVLNHTWQRFGMDRLLAAMGSARQRNLLKAMIYARLLFPCAKLSVQLQAQGTWLAAACQLAPSEAFDEDDLYEAMDQMNGHWVKLEKDLYGQAFPNGLQLTLYDLSSTYFEGQCAGNDMARRGYSRDSRGDCLQVVIALIVINVVRAKRPAGRDFRQDRFRETALAGIHFSGPRAGATAAVPHRSQEIWPGIERQRREDVGAGQMVLESGALGRWQRAGRAAMKMADEVAFAIPGHAVAEDEVVHPAADVDRVNLGETMVSECGIDTGSRCIEQKRAAVEAAGIER